MTREISNGEPTEVPRAESGGGDSETAASMEETHNENESAGLDVVDKLSFDWLEPDVDNLRRLHNTGGRQSNPPSSSDTKQSFDGKQDIGLAKDDVRPPAASTSNASSSAAALEEKDPLVGQLLFEDYLIAGVLGSNSASITYEALQKSQDRIVAIKTTRHLQSAITKEFMNVATGHMSLGHKNIVASLGVLESPLHRPFYVMEFLDGIPLLNVIEASGALVDEEEVAEVVLPLCDAVACAHEKNMVHGNLNSSNVMLTDVGDRIDVKVLDFGFSKVRDKIGGAGETSASFADQMKMDILMIGRLVYEVVTGIQALELAPDGTLLNRKPLKEVSNDLLLPDKLDEVLAEAMDPDLDWRFDSASDFREAFENWLAGAREERVKQEEKEEQKQQQQERQEMHLQESVAEEQPQLRETQPTPEAGATVGEEPPDRVPAPAANKPSRKKRSNLASRTIFNLKQLKTKQVSEEAKLATQLTGVFKVQGARVSPAKTVAILSMKLIAAVSLGLLAMTWLILNGDKIGPYWTEYSTKLSAMILGSEQSIPPEVEVESGEEPAEAAVKKAGKPASGAAAMQSGGLPAGSDANESTPIKMEAPQKRFRYDEHPSFRHWVLKDVGPKRRLDRPLP